MFTFMFFKNFFLKKIKIHWRPVRLLSRLRPSQMSPMPCIPSTGTYMVEVDSVHQISLQHFLFHSLAFLFPFTFPTYSHVGNHVQKHTQHRRELYFHCFSSGLAASPDSRKLTHIPSSSPFPSLLSVCLTVQGDLVLITVAQAGL